MRYIPSLDGLRALAVLAVIGKHTGTPGFTEGGTVGVGLFFVLSGYLITQVLAERPSLSEFYWRRALRLIPALALMLLVYLALAPLIWPGYPHLRDAALAFFYLSDYTWAFLDVPRYLNHTWSLSVEEHFYMLWPLAFITFRPGRKALFAAFIIATLWMYAWPDGQEAYRRFDTRCAGLLLGCMLAGLPRDRIPAWPGMLGLAAICYVGFPPDRLGGNLTMTAVDLASAVAIIGRSPRWLSNLHLVYLGRISYGVYLWQTPIRNVGQTIGLYWPELLLFTLALSVLIAAASFSLVETPIKQWGRKAAPA